jgi:head-tail adaptor
MAFDKDPNIGRMRWSCYLATRTVVPPSITNPIQTDQYTNMRLVYAEIIPVSRFRFFNSKQTDTKVTHSFTIRYQDQIDMFDTILRNVVNPDGTAVQELFRIERVAPDDGRKRFMYLDCVQQTQVTR